MFVDKCKKKNVQNAVKFYQFPWMYEKYLEH